MSKKAAWVVAGIAASLFAAARLAPAAEGEGKRPLVFDVRDYGAKGDGKTVDTDAINKAIDAAAAAGGGTVHFGAGIYPSFSIHMKSNITLHLEQGAVLQAAGRTLGGLPGPRDFSPGGRRGNNGGGRAATVPAGEPETSATAPVTTRGIIGPPPGTAGLAPAYDAPEPNPAERSEFGINQDFGHSHWHNSLIWGENLHDIAITGLGMIDGNGLAYNPPATAVGVGNKVLALKQCRNVTLRDITFYRGGHFCILATAVDNFTIDNAKFDTVRDAIDVVSCKNVRISNCYVNSPFDDGICLKADYSLGAPRDCENITITNCFVAGYRVGTMLDGTFDRSATPIAQGAVPTGRIKFGTESNGGFKNITISNCVFDHCRGLAMESVDGGVIEDVTVSNISMRDICNAPIFIRLGNRHRSPLGPETPVAQIRRINISDLTVSGSGTKIPCLISGIPGHPIEDLRISNVQIRYLGGGTAADAALQPAEAENAYPEPMMFGTLPAAAFYIRHVKGLEMHHVDVSFDAADARPAFVLDDVVGADFQHMKVQRFEGVPYFALKQVSDFSTQFVRSLADMRREKVDQEMISK